MNSLPTSACRYCPKKILWAIHPESGRAMPLDAEPSPKGTWRVEAGADGKLLGFYVKKTDAGAVGLFADELLHESHWSTCAGAKKARLDADAKGKEKL
jgi:hypothetical protein